MNDKKPKKSKNSLLKWLVALLVIIILFSGLRMALKSDWLLDYARDIAEEQANEQLNGTLKIGAIRGDLLFGITLSDITVSDPQQNEILAVDTLQLQYTIPSLVSAPHRLDLLRLEGVHGTLIQDQDSVWNAERLLPPADPGEETEPFYWSVDRILMDHANISVQSDILLPDGRLEIEDLSIQSFVEMFPDRWIVSLDHLSMKLIEGRLPSPVEVSMQAAAMDELITLESLVVNTGRSLLNSEAAFADDEIITGFTEFTPLSRQDIAAYLEDYPIQKDLKIGLTAEGTLDNFTLSVTADAGSGGQLSVAGTTDISDPYVLKNLAVELSRFNGTELLGDTTLPSFNYASLNGSGAVHILEPRGADWEGDLTVEALSFDKYSLDRGTFSYRIDNQAAGMDGSLEHQEETIRMEANASSIFGERPVWQAFVYSDSLNLATWLQDPQLESRFTLSANAEGSGIAPTDLTSTFDLLVSDGFFGSQPFSRLHFNGTINPAEITGNVRARIDESRAAADFDVKEWAGDPGYSFNLGLEEVNLAEFSGLEELPTYLNGTLTGEGRSFDLEELEMNAAAKFDSSIVNGAPIDSLRAGFKIEGESFFIENAILESTIADAEFSLRQHLLEFKNPQNRLEFSAQVKDLFPLGPVLGFERLTAVGELGGELWRNSAGILEFEGNIELEEVEADSIFAADRVTGNATARLLNDPELEGKLEIGRPMVMGQTMQDLIFSATATFSEAETAGDIGFELINDEESELIHVGKYSFTPEQSLLTTSRLDFVTPERTLSLRRNFDIVFADDILRVDTMRVQSVDEQAYIEFWAPHIDSLSQNIGLDARRLNVGVLQRTLVGEEAADGFFSGFIQLNNSPDSLSITTTGHLSDIQYENGKLDSLKFSGNIEEEWLDLSFTATHDDAELFSSHARLPFLPGDPVTFNDQFFDRTIEGEFILNQTDVNYWLSFMPENPTNDTKGLLSFEGKLSGTAGNPEFQGDLKFSEGRLSGVPVDSLGVHILYVHDEEEVEINGDITSRSERVFDFNSRVPFKIDLKELKLRVPTDEDSFFADLETQDFNVALLNDFVDRNQIRQIAGRLNGTLNISGTLAELEPRGRLELTRGSMRVVPAGITISKIGTQVEFSSELIELQQFSMESGPGRVRASGTLAIENLKPGELDMQIRGSQFRAANTSEYNAIVDFNSNITGTFEEPVLEGSLSFLSGFVNLQNFGERAIEDVELEGEDKAEELAFYESLVIEMDVNFDRQFFIRNSQFLDLEIELGGQVDLLKRKNEDMQMFGQLEGVRGFARPLGKNFVIDEAFVTFAGPVDNPELDVKTKFEPPEARADVVIYYIIEGTAQDPEFRFDSEPQMELQDIISYTVFGRPFYELESWEQAVAGGGGGGPTVADVAMEVILDRVGMMAAQSLGIDVFRIDNSRTGSSSNTSILTGWYLNRRTFFALVNEISTSPKTLFLLEYMLTENLELIITQGDDTRQGVDLRWKYDY